MKTEWLITALMVLFLTLHFRVAPGQAMAREGSGPVGFASVNGDGFTGPVTGGGEPATSSNVVTIHGPAEFRKLVYLLYDRHKAYRNKADFGTAKYAPLVIILEGGIYPEAAEVPQSGSIWGNSMLAIQEQGDLTIIGRGDVVLQFGINVKRSWNTIIRNITFQDYYDDGVNIGEPETHHVWVDHCTFGHPTTRPANKEHPDGGVDIKDGASYITVSWCHFRNSWKTGLVGHSDNNGATDTGRLKTTFYMNYYLNTHSRHPRVRFGEVHVLNNLYEGVTNYGIAAANQARVVAEGNFFLNTVWPMYADRTKNDFTSVYGPWSSETGNYPAAGLKQSGNLYDDSGLTRIFTAADIRTAMLNPGNKSIRFDELNPAAVFDPHDYYSYTAADAATLPELVKAGAGAGKVDFFVQTSTSGGMPQPSGHPLLVFPLPVQELFTITSPGPGIVTIHTLSGKKVYTTLVPEGNTSFSARQMNLTAGIYLLTFAGQQQFCSLKMAVLP
jgi:pectate lyase